MINGKKVLAIIPARGGSKRLPKKNVLPLAGKPLIASTIDAANQSVYIDSVYVSTDCKEIADVALKYGARIPYMRSKDLSDDKATTVSVVLDFCERKIEEFDVIILLQPTSPFRNSIHIDKALEQFSKGLDSVVSVTELEHPIEWTNTLDENLSMTNFVNEKYAGLRSQDFEKRYRLNGAIYIVDKQTFLNEKSFITSKNSQAFIMEQIDSLDIDTLLDYTIAQAIISLR